MSQNACPVYQVTWEYNRVGWWGYIISLDLTVFYQAIFPENHLIFTDYVRRIDNFTKKSKHCYLGTVYMSMCGESISLFLGVEYTNHLPSAPLKETRYKNGNCAYYFHCYKQGKQYSRDNDDERTLIITHAAKCQCRGV